jgi:hypothetical protein
MTAAARIACDDDSPTAPRVIVPQLSTQIPFSEEYRASGTIAPSAGCPAGQLQASLDGDGTGTHVGPYTTQCLDLTTGAFTNGTFVKTAAEVALHLEGAISSVGSGS